MPGTCVPLFLSLCPSLFSMVRPTRFIYYRGQLKVASLSFIMKLVCEKERERGNDERQEQYVTMHTICIEADIILSYYAISSLVPDYMRTKLELDLEAKQRDLHAVAASPPQGFEVHYIHIEILMKTLESNCCPYILSLVLSAIEFGN